ncbi:MAG: AMP-binding protein [Paracoccaceae bacterium]
MKWLDELVVKHEQDSPAIIDHDGRTFSYGDLAKMVETMASTLTAHGVRPGDRLMLVSENCATYAVTVLAAFKLKVWVSPINARQSVEELEVIKQHSGARCMVFTPEASAASADHAKRLGASVFGSLPCGEILATQTYDATPEAIEDDPKSQVAALMYTTGTTSAPKGVMLTHSNLIWNALQSAKLRQMASGDIVLGVLPGTHIFGFASALLASFYAGVTIRFMPQYSPEAVLQSFAEGVSVMPAVPQMYQGIVQYLEARGKKPNAPKLRYISSGGAPLDPEWKAKIEDFFGLPLNNGYGLTETSPGVAATRPDNPRNDISVGEVMEGVEIIIYQPDTDGIGELLIRGPNIMKGYYRNEKTTREVFRPDGYFCSGDFARIGSDGELYIAGRKKELIIRSGFNVYPPEVEAMLTRHPNILQAAVVGRNISGNEEILAFLLTNGGLSEVEVKAWLHDRLVGYKIPQHVLIIDSFPTAPTGKILKHKLTEVYADLLETRDAKVIA